MLLVIMLPLRPVVGMSALPCSFQTGLTVLADLLAAAGVLVVGGHVSDPGVSLTVFQCT